jgi:hypothetical protein
MKTVGCAVLALWGALPAWTQEPGQEYGECPVARRTLWCDACKAFVDRTEPGEKRLCPRCRGAVIGSFSRDVTAYACAACGRTRLEPGECCGAARQETEARAIILYRCPGCAKIAFHEGPCHTKACRKAGLSFQKKYELPEPERCEEHPKD